MMNRKVGLLLPRSVIYPSIGFDLMAGLKSGLENIGISDAEVKTESIGLGADDKQVFTVCEKLLFDGAGIVAGYVNPTTAEKLEPLFASANAIFIALDAGYHFPSSFEKHPHVFYLSLQGALCIRTNTLTATKEGKKSMAFTGSFYDSGYRTAFAFNSGLDDGGGKITYNLITPLKRADMTLEPLMAHLKEQEVDAVFASFCGDMLQDFCLAAATDNVFKDHALYGSSFAGEEQWLEQIPYPGVDMKVCVPWATTLDNESNAHFTESLKRNNQKVNIFSLLGWEAAQLIGKALVRPIVEAITMLEGFTFSSPRGIVQVDAITHVCHAPVYEAWVKKNNETGNCVLEVIRESPYTEEQRSKLAHDINNISGPMSSWQNAYACLDS
ncbi:MAG: hypothetical protein JWQ38_2961 [Flavipsychrobacter sp.]|nr:hypothetical protein [Flavipsychrobacter sp.]